LEGRAGSSPSPFACQLSPVAGKTPLPDEHLRKSRPLHPQSHPETFGAAVEGSALGICTSVLQCQCSCWYK